MKNTIKKELKQHILDYISEGIITEDNVDESHHYLFNQDYYLIGYYNCEQWLKKHDISAFEAISICQQYEKDNFGEITNTYDNSESVVNMLVYIYGEELLSGFEGNTVESLKEFVENIE